MMRPFKHWSPALALVFACLPAAAQSWEARGEGGEIRAGYLLDGEFVGLRFECPAPGSVRTVLSHNGAVFERDRDHTVVLSVDGVASVLSTRAVPGARPGDDDFVRLDPLVVMQPLLEALAAGSAVEVSAPSGRYTLPLAGSSRALAAFGEACAR